MKTKKRLFPRIDVTITIKQVGNAVNISEGGTCILADNPLPIGSRIDLELLLSDSPGVEGKSSDTARLEGTVVWLKYSELFNKYEIGVKFTDTHDGDKEKIKSFVESHT